MKKLIGFMIALCFFVSCEGPTGPIGPQGIQGIKGETGNPGKDFTYWTGTTVLNAEGSGAIYLPSDAGTETKPPLVDYYMSDGSGGWYSMATDKYYFGHTIVGIVRFNGLWAVVIGDGIAGRTFMVVSAW